MRPMVLVGVTLIMAIGHFVSAATGQASSCPLTCPATSSIDYPGPCQDACYTFAAGPFSTGSGRGTESCVTCRNCVVNAYVTFDGKTGCEPDWELKTIGQFGGQYVGGTFGSSISSGFGCFAPCSGEGDLSFYAFPPENPFALCNVLNLSIDCGCG